MKTMDDRQAQALMEKFLNGTTTIAEEQQLYRYFAAGDVAPVLQQYRPMMQWYRSLSADTVTAGKPVQSRRSPLNQFRFAAGIAASVAILATIGFAALKPHTRLNDEQIADSVSRLVASIKNAPDIWETELARISDSTTRQMILRTIHDVN